MGVGSQTSNVAVLGDCGRYPLFIEYFTKVVHYWFRLLNMEETRFPKQCYYMLKERDASGKVNWVTGVKSLLLRYGFGVVWMWQGVGCEDSFIREYKQRLKNCWQQDWRSSVQENKKLKYYYNFKVEFGVQMYLKVIKSPSHRHSLARFRAGNHSLNIEKGRHKGVEKGERLCLYCLSERNYHIEDEYHFFAKCSLYSNLRVDKLFKNLTVYDFNKLMSTREKTDILKIARFVNNCFAKREDFFNSM